VHHYGMTIMEERARTLAGEVRYEARPQGGTRVVLGFRPTSRRVAYGADTTQILRRLET
jgi:two-component system nitrate/nitrite sensor histidine kinase NarX